MSEQPHESIPQRLERDIGQAEEWLDEEVITIRRTLHRDVKLQTRWLILALLVACGIGVALGWGQSQSPFNKTGASLTAIEATLKQQGLRICTTENVPVNRLQGAQTAQADVLGFHTCPSTTSGENVLTVYRFNSSGARNSAALAFLGGRGRAAGVGPQGSLWTYGPYLITLSGQRSDIVDQLTHNGLKALGAN